MSVRFSSVQKGKPHGTDRVGLATISGEDSIFRMDLLEIRFRNTDNETTTDFVVYFKEWLDSLGA